MLILVIMLQQQRLDLDTVRRPVLEARGQDGEVVEQTGLDPAHRFGLDGVGGLDSFELALMATSIVSLTLSAVILTKMAELQEEVGDPIEPPEVRDKPSEEPQKEGSRGKRSDSYEYP